MHMRSLLVLMVVALAGWHANAEVAVTRDVVFAEVDETKLKLDLYVPKVDSKPPLVVWVHGGGWRGGSKSSVPLKGLNEHGYAIASISYRFSKQAIFPAQIHDCKAAIRFLRANAEEYGYDASWIAVGGSSAGGQLALLLGTSGGVEELEGTVGGNLNQSSTVQAVVDYFGPSDFVLRGKTQPERAYTTKSGSFAMLGGVKHGKIDPKLEIAASPVTHVDADDPPLLIFHGDKDQVVLIDQAHRMAEVYREHGLDVTLHVEPGGGHGTKGYFTPPLMKKLVDFLQANR